MSTVVPITYTNAPTDTAHTTWKVKRRLQIDSTTKLGVESKAEQFERMVRQEGSSHAGSPKNRLLQDVIEQLHVYRGRCDECRVIVRLSCCGDAVPAEFG